MADIDEVLKAAKATRDEIDAILGDGTPEKELGMRVKIEVDVKLMCSTDLGGGEISMFLSHGEATDTTSPISSVSGAVDVSSWIHMRNGDWWRLGVSELAGALQAKLIELGLAEWQKVEKECPHCHALNAVIGEDGELIICWNCDDASEYDGENLIQVD